MATQDPRRVADSKDAWVTALYAKTAGSTANDGVLPLVIDANGYLCINMTVGTISLNTTAVTISNAAGNPANVSLANSGVTISLARTLTGSTGSLNATNGTISLTPSNKAKVYAFSLTTTSATEVTCVFHSGSVANGLELWRCTLMAPSGANSGANLAVSPPGFLFASRSGTAVSLSLSTAVLVHYSLSYFDEA